LDPYIKAIVALGAAKRQIEYFVWRMAHLTDRTGQPTAAFVPFTDYGRSAFHQQIRAAKPFRRDPHASLVIAERVRGRIAPSPHRRVTRTPDTGRDVGPGEHAGSTYARAQTGSDQHQPAHQMPDDLHKPVRPR
jgi:hypothetical protein